MTADEKNTRSQFEAFLKGKLSFGQDCAKYSRDLDTRARKKSQELSCPISTLYSVTSASTVRDFRNRIAASQKMVYTRKKTDVLAEGLDWYIEFLDLPVQPAVTPGKKRISRATPDEEGKHVTREQTVIQRNLEARRKCIEIYGYKCAACGKVMTDMYGELGKDFIEVHHRSPIHLFDDTHVVDPEKDLIPLCPNCHAMIHKLKDPGDVELLKSIIQESLGSIE